MSSLAIHYFVHSTSTDNEAGIRAGWSDPGLADTGKRQASELATQVAELDLDAVFASDLARAVETARLIFGEDRVNLDCRLREMNYGVLNGMPGELFPEDEQLIDHRMEGGESCLDVEERVRAFLADIASEYETVAIVSHRFPQLALEVICNRLDWRRAIATDWRREGYWQPGWIYRFEGK